MPESSNFNTVSIIGLGYIGLPIAAMFASRKENVIGVDVNQQAVDTINEGEIHIVEPDLDISTGRIPRSLLRFCGVSRSLKERLYFVDG